MHRRLTLSGSLCKKFFFGREVLRLTLPKAWPWEKAQLESGAGPHGPLATDKALFSAPAAEHAGEEAPDPALEKLAALDVDSFNPRDALALLYALRSQLLTRLTRVAMSQPEKSPNQICKS